MTSGGQCVMTLGTALMLLWYASNWDMHTLEVRMMFIVCIDVMVVRVISHFYYAIIYRW